MCSTAIYLKQSGFRSFSSIFDWADSTIEGNIRLVQNHFSHFLDKKYLTQNYKDYPSIITNTLYNYTFVHYFNDKITFEKQIKAIMRRSKKAIAHFYDALNTGQCTLVYYLRKNEEINWIKKNSTVIDNFVNNYKCTLIFISNYKFTLGNYKVYVIPTNNVHKPFGGAVSFPFEKTEDIDLFLSDCISKNDRCKNIKFNNKKHFLKKIIKHFCELFRSRRIKLSLEENIHE